MFYKYDLKCFKYVFICSLQFVAFNNILNNFKVRVCLWHFEKLFTYIFINKLIPYFQVTLYSLP